jgi:hypothetical protein
MFVLAFFHPHFLVTPRACKIQHLMTVNHT